MSTRLLPAFSPGMIAASEGVAQRFLYKTRRLFQSLWVHQPTLCTL
ncbi:MAG: hypothetical protein K6T90_13860 [Leptolyngbyaceae cyanobacterium HOT.MB2.61]|nr:hypothetical protein [Leptolyngbyaceae cyanobacterium HOT.MB2.61]